MEKNNLYPQYESPKILAVNFKSRAVLCASETVDSSIENYEEGTWTW